MGLSCGCNVDDFDWYYQYPDDFETMPGKRRSRCLSCHNLIDIGAVCVIFPCYRNPLHEIEERIYGDEVPIANRYLCEKCGEIFFNLHELGYCINLGDDMRELLKEYQEMTGFKVNG